MVVLLSLCSAVAYGSADFLGGLVSRRTSAWQVAVVAQLSATGSTAVAAVLTGGSPRAGDFGWAAVAGVGTGIGTGFLYRGFAAGRMGVVAPLSAVGAALVPVAAGATAGERPDALVWLGITLALPGIWLVSRVAEELPGSGRGSFAEGVVDGLLAGVGFGALFAALGQMSDAAGLWPLATAQAVSLPTVVLLASLLGAAWVPHGGATWWASVIGPLGAAATVTFLLTTRHGLLTVSGVLASLYPAVTVLLAATLLREHVHRAQGVGLGLCGVAVVLVAVG